MNSLQVELAVSDLCSSEWLWQDLGGAQHTALTASFAVSL